MASCQTPNLRNPQSRLPHLRRLTYRNYFIDVEEGEKTQHSPGSLRARSVPTERTRRFSSFNEGAEEELEREKDGFSNAAQRMGFGHDGVVDKLGEGAKTPVDSVLVSFFPTGVVEFLEDKTIESMGLAYLNLHLP